MDRTFHLFLSAANMLLFAVTLVAIYSQASRAKSLNVSLFHRGVGGWAAGSTTWRDFYDEDYTTQQYEEFLPRGLEAVSCTQGSQVPLCKCLEAAYEKGKTTCRKVARSEVGACMMISRPQVIIDELEQSLNPFIILDILNWWGMLASIVVAYKLYVDKESTVPYFSMLVVGVLLVILHGLVMERHLAIYVIYILAVLLMTGLSWVHSEEKSWSVMQYAVQYAFAVPHFALIAMVGSQQRDALYVIVMLMFAITFSLTAMGRTLLELTDLNDYKSRDAINVSYASLLVLFLILTLSAYEWSGNSFMLSAHATQINTFHLGFMMYLLLGMFCPKSLDRVSFMDLAIRFMMTMGMLLELGLST